VKTKGAIKNGQSRDTDNIEHTRHRTETKPEIQCVAHLSFCFEEALYRTFHMCFLPNLN